MTSIISGFTTSLTALLRVKRRRTRVKKVGFSQLGCLNNKYGVDCCKHIRGACLKVKIAQMGYMLSNVKNRQCIFSGNWSI